MKILKVTANNRRRAFEVHTRRGVFPFPYSRLELLPSSKNPITRACVDNEWGRKAFTYELQSGDEATIHIDAVLEYNEDPDYLTDLLLYKLTVESRKRVDSSSLSTRELIRRLGTSASQFYRLLDPTNYRKSVRQMVTLLHALDWDVEFVVKKRKSA